MATIKAIIKKSRVKKNGEAPIILRIIKDRSNGEISLKRAIPEKYWDSNKGLSKSNYPVSTALNALIRKECSNIQSIIDKFEIEGEEYTIRNVIDKYRGVDLQSNKSTITLAQYFKEYLESNPTDIGLGAMKYYKTVYTQLSKLFKRVKLSDVSVKHLKKYENYLKGIGNQQNTIHGRLKVLRKILYKAKKEGLIVTNPFENYSIKQEKTRRTFLVEDEINTLAELELTQESYKLVRDMFVFACFSGIRFSDVARLRVNNIVPKNDHYYLSFRIAKTKEVLTFKLPSRAKEMVDKYNDLSNQEALLFPILAEKVFKDEKKLFNQISSKNAYFNKVLKLLAEKAGVTKHLSFHISRHTFATVALSRGVPIEVLSKLLGHADLKTTQIYGKIMDKAKDDAMDKFDF